MAADRRRLNYEFGIIIPEIEFKQEPIADAVKFLNESAIAHDPEKKGVNIVLMTPHGDLFGDFFGGLPAGLSDPMNMTMNLRRVSLYDALKYCCEVTGSRMQIDDDGIILTP